MEGEVEVVEQVGGGHEVVPVMVEDGQRKWSFPHAFSVFD
jgi:hypothetical protein